MCRTLFQATMSRAIEPCNLIFGETDYFNLSMSVQSPPASANTVFEGMCYAQNRLPHLLWDGCSQTSVVVCIIPTNDCCVTTYKSNRFSTFTYNLRRCTAWLAILGSIGHPSITYWKPPAPLSWPTLNMLKRYGARRRTRKTPNGSRTSSNTIWCLAALSLLRISASFGI